MVSYCRNEASLLRRTTGLQAQVLAPQAEEERTTIALAQSSVGVFDWDLRRHTVFVSPILQDMLGYEGESLPDQLDKWIEHVHSSDRVRVQKELREALMYGQEHFEGVYQMVRTDGAVRSFLFRAVIMRASRVEGGEAVRVLGTAVDVTGRVA